MKITVSTNEGQVTLVECLDSTDLQTFLTVTLAQLNIAQSTAVSYFMIHNGKQLSLSGTNSNNTVSSVGIQDDDMVMLMNQSSVNAPPASVPSIDFSGIKIPTNLSKRNISSASSSSSKNKVIATDIEFFRNNLLNDPGYLAYISERNPELANAVNNKERFGKIITEMQNKSFNQQRELIELQNANQFDTKVQERIAEIIKTQNINNTLEHAMEHNPEYFARVTMLYIECKVFGHNVKAFVDSGAESTLMSEACARRCNVDRLIDTRFSGEAVGVGRQKILGRVHTGVIQIGDKHLPTSFSVLQNQPMDLLLGLDMLKRHQCVIDLRRNALVIGSMNTEVNFLPESEMPESAKLNNILPTSSSATTLETEASMLSKDVDSSKIEAIISHGFSREEAETALVDASNDLDAALANLLSKSFNST